LKAVTTTVGKQNMGVSSSDCTKLLPHGLHLGDLLWRQIGYDPREHPAAVADEGQL
jgi:hypothetical protein